MSTSLNQNDPNIKNLVEDEDCQGSDSSPNSEKLILENQNQTSLENYYWTSLLGENDSFNQNIQAIDLDSNHQLNDFGLNQIRNIFPFQKNGGENFNVNNQGNLCEVNGLANFESLELSPIEKNPNLNENIKGEVSNNNFKISQISNQDRYFDCILIDNNQFESQFNLNRINNIQPLNEFSNKEKILPQNITSFNNNQLSDIKKFKVFTPKIPLELLDFSSQPTSSYSTNNTNNNNFNNNKFFPTLQKNSNNSLSFVSSSEDKQETNTDNKITNTSSELNPLFKTTKLGRKRLPKKPRKNKTDDIRKKIKSRFHKELLHSINKKLKSASSELIFQSCPQCLVSNVSKSDFNKKILNFSYKKIIETNFFKDNKYCNEKIDPIKYQKNLDVLKYLEENPFISQNSGFDEIKETKYEDLLKEYFNSLEFEETILRLREEEENEEYIRKYINLAKGFIDFYKGNKQ